MVDLQPFGSAADHAGLVPLVDEDSESAPVPAAPDLSSLLPGPLPVPFPFAFGASAGRVEDVVAAGTDVAERAQGVSPGSTRRSARLTWLNASHSSSSAGSTRIGARGPVPILMAGRAPEAILSRTVRSL
jgi:hypothetical protein